MIPPSGDVECSYGVDVVKGNGKSIHLGDYSTKEELDQAIQESVENGKLTEQEAASSIAILSVFLYNKDKRTK